MLAQKLSAMANLQIDETKLSDFKVCLMNKIALKHA